MHPPCEQKVSVWAKQNRGVRARSARDVELEEVSKPTLESARAALERKAAVYEKLRRGKSGGLNDKQYESLLVDVRDFITFSTTDELTMWMGVV